MSAGVILGDEACDCCQPEIIVNDQYVIMFFRNNATNIRDIKAVVSYDRGATFTNWISVDDHLWNIMSCPSTGPDARFTGPSTMVSVYKTEVLGEAKIFINEYDLSTGTTVAMVNLAAGTGVSPNYPQIASENGDLAAVWEGQGTDADIFFNWSTTGVAGFDTLNSINITNSVGIQSKPDITYGNGVYHIVWAEGGVGGIKYVQAGEGLTIPENILKDKIVIYPNPVGDLLKVEMDLPSSGNGTIKVLDMNGKLIKEWPFNGMASTNRADFDVSSLSSGAYIVEVTFAGSSWSQELIKK